MVGRRMLWVGWFGFNGGSALAADGDAAMAMIATHIAAAAAGLVWMAARVGAVRQAEHGGHGHRRGRRAWPP